MLRGLCRRRVRRLWCRALWRCGVWRLRGPLRRCGVRPLRRRLALPRLAFLLPVFVAAARCCLRDLLFLRQRLRVRPGRENEGQRSAEQQQRFHPHHECTPKIRV
jgi:hypothetical protein